VTSTAGEPMIPITSVNIDAEIEEAVLAVLRSGQLAQGPVVAEFEEACAAMAGTRHAVAVSNGTVSLLAALQALGVGPGDEVITSPFTFVATINAAVHVGATVRFADIGDDFLVRADSIDALMNDRTRAIMPVHLYGLMPDMAAIDGIARRHGIAMVEDAAQAHGADVDGRRAGSWGVGSFSFYATKNVSTGEGGVLTTDDDRIADRLRLLRNQGMRARYQYEMPGFNLRMTDLQAAIGVPQMRRLDATNRARQQNARCLSDGLAGLAGVVTPVTPAGRTHVFHQYTIRVTPETGVGRDEVVARLQRSGIGAGVYYPHRAYDYACFADHPRIASTDPCPVAKQMAQEVVSLPVHPLLSESDLDRIIEAVRSAVRT
jgi:perosamine synthetase